MLSFRSICVPATLTAAVLLLGLCSQAVALSPQPEPPDSWRIEGFIDISIETMARTGAEVPFGIDPAIVKDGQVDFSAGMIATFKAQSSTRSDTPDDGTYSATSLPYFRATFGNTSWDETMFVDPMQITVEGGVVSHVAVLITDTRPQYPDLQFGLPDFPDQWLALDKRGTVDLGMIGGTYTLRDGVTPEPATLSLLAVGALALIRRKRK